MNPTTRALILAGDAYHNPNDAFEGVGEALRTEGIAVECTTDFAHFHERLPALQLLVIHRDGMEYPNGVQAGPARWMRPEQEDAIEQFVLNGGGFLALHNAGWDYPWQGGYRRALVNHYMSAESLLPWHWGDKPQGSIAGLDYRDIVMIAGKDPYAWKGIEERAAAHVRPSGEGGCGNIERNVEALKFRNMVLLSDDHDDHEH